MEMRMRTLRDCLILLCAAASFLARVDAATPLDTVVLSFSASHESPYMVSMRLATEFSVPVGFEGVPEDPEEPVTVTVANGTIRSALEKLVSADPRYKWNLTPEGAINIFPKNPSERLLDVNISHYEVKDSTRQRALDDLLDTPEVAAAFRAAGVKVRTPIAGGYEANGCSATFGVKLDNVSMRTALNAILKASGSVFWSATRYGSALQYLALPIAGSHCYGGPAH